MATDVELPQLGESVTEGTITAWLVEVGDTVEADQPLFELSSDKIDTEVPSPAAGTVTEILVGVDETVEVGTVVARIGDAAEGAASDEPAAEEAPAAAEEAPAADEAGDPELHADADDAGAAEGPEPAAEPEAGSDEAAAGGDGAAVDVTLPELGESVTEGTVTAWLVEVGDTVEADQPLFELSSDKIDTEVPSPAAGTVTEILVGVDETVEVGTVVARIGGSAAPASAPAPESPAPESPAPESPAPESPAPESAAPAAGSDALASPLVRSLAREHGIDLGTVSGTGQGGRITREDIEAAIGTAPAAPTPSAATPSASPATPATPAKPAAAPAAPRAAGDRERVEDLSRIRQRIAEKMLESQREAAQLTTVQEVDVTALMTARAQHKDAFTQREGVSLSPFAMVARAALMAVRNHPLINATADWTTGKLYLRDYVNLGIAVDTPKGLLVPNVKGADGLTVAGLARGIAEAAQKARGEGGRKLDFADIEGGTFTLTNTGSVGVLIDTPILNHPEVAILGVGAIRRRPAVVQGVDGSEAIAIRDMMYLSLTYDHRLLDGADAARFVTEVKTVCETTDWEQEIG
jgi:pyruvate dehydrogenase E2 component (dihydrolipoamide acetyltransferase)